MNPRCPGIMAAMAVVLAAAPVVVTTSLVSPLALRVDGVGPGAHTGASVAGAGDVNGDGHPDDLFSGLLRTAR